MLNPVCVWDRIYGCSEQIASQTYPSLVYLDQPEYGISNDKASKSISRALNLLSARQNEDGSFKIWPGYNQTNEYLSVHIIRFLVEAKMRGIDISDSMYGNSIGYLKMLANRQINSLSEARNTAYAIFVLSVDSQITTNYLKAVHESLNGMKNINWQSDVTALFVAASYKILQLDKEAIDVYKQIPAITQSKDSDLYVDNLSYSAHYLQITSKYFPEKISGITPQFIESVSQQLSENSYSTLSSSLSVLALSDYQKVKGKDLAEKVSVLIGKDQSNLSAVQLDDSLTPSANITTPNDINPSLVRISANEKSAIFYGIEQTGFDKTNLEPIKNGLEIAREYRNDKGEVITQAQLGDDIEVRITVRSLESPAAIGEVAVVDLLPAGFELSNGSLSLNAGQQSTDQTAWYPFYTDAREDRALLYGYLDSSARTYTYKVKAVSKGDFVVPPIQVESMYRQQYVARSAEGVFSVK